jgi:hypothetical protein
MSRGFVVMVAILLVIGAWLYYLRSQGEDREREVGVKIQAAVDACLTGNRLVFDERLVDARSAIYRLDSPNWAEFETKLDNRLKEFGCPTR